MSFPRRPSRTPSRRDLMKMGAMGAGYAALFPHSTLASIPSSFWDNPVSPSTTPFIQRLPAAPVAKAMRPFDLDPRAEAELLLLPEEMIKKARYYTVFAEPARLQLHPELPLTDVWRYRDIHTPVASPSLAGPTFLAEIGVPTIVRHLNRLPEDHMGFGVTELSVHLHGGHMAANSDGFPGPIINPPFDPFYAPPGHPVHPDHFDYVYGMGVPGFLDGEPEATDVPSFLWYHDHSLDFTGPNVIRGLAGMFMVHDERDSGDEQDTSRGAFRLPSGEFDVPLLVADRLIAPDGSLVYMPGSFDGFLGDKYLVNGVVQPFMEAKRRKYRLRFLNGSNARMFRFQIQTESGDAVPMTQIATEGGLMSSPLDDQTSVFLTMAHRREMIVDFKAFPRGTVLYLVDLLGQDDGRGPDGKFNAEDFAEVPTKIMKIIVTDEVRDFSQVPSEFRQFPDITASDLANAERHELVFERKNGSWVINDEHVDLERPMFGAKQGAGVILTLKNKSGGWWHPIHIHSEFFRFLSRSDDGGLIPEEGTNQARHDLANLGPNSEVDVFIKFRDYPGEWVAHCHNIEHEDHFMMTRFDVLPKDA